MVNTLQKVGSGSSVGLSDNSNLSQCLKCVLIFIVWFLRCIFFDERRKRANLMYRWVMDDCPVAGAAAAYCEHGMLRHSALLSAALSRFGGSSLNFLHPRIPTLHQVTRSPGARASTLTKGPSCLCVFICVAPDLVVIEFFLMSKSCRAFELLESEFWVAEAEGLDDGQRRC